MISSCNKKWEKWFKIERKHKNSINDAKNRSVCSLMQTKPNVVRNARVSLSLAVAYAVY